MPPDPGIDRMFEEIHKSFELDKTRHCKFIPEQVTNTVMLNTEKNLLAETDEVFLSYTKASLDNLASRIENEVFATGGYYLFADYIFNETRFLCIILARKKDGFNIEFNDKASTFDFKDTKNINIYKLAMAFEKISRELKDEKRSYFDALNQAQDKIKSQVVAVPLSIGTSVYAFFQIKADVVTFYFILAMLAIYIFFICWYLYLYDKDLKKLRSEITEETSNFETRYPEVFKIFKDDFSYINKKIASVLLLSWVIKSTIIIDWVLFLVFILLVVNHRVENPPFYPFRYL
ncbi:nucleoid-associated protein [Pedobacter paludis]|uniref:Uncharacterized protein n=1 Tax=Pedobacter paludis TaxID=2203212 RepID=A0A317EWY1_9SPHI|nr:hypothetical protein DF947_18825 [Pedobacter paludis]